MTTDLEKQFFDKFEIEPIKRRTCSNAGDCPDEYSITCDTCDYWRVIREDYPEITDRILLGLILINMHNEDLFGYPTNIQELKDNTLKQLIETYNKFSICVTCDGEYQQSARNIKHQVQELFKGN